MTLWLRVKDLESRDELTDVIQGDQDPWRNKNAVLDEERPGQEKSDLTQVPEIIWQFVFQYIYIFQWVFGFWELRILTLLILHHTLWRTTFLLTPFGWYCPILSLHSLLQLECTPTICWERIYHILKLWVMTHDGKFVNETRYFSVISWYWITRLILPIAFDHRNWVFWSGNPGCLKQIWFKDISSDTSGSITAKNM